MILYLVVFFWMNKNISLRKHSVQSQTQHSCSNNKTTRHDTNKFKAEHNSRQTKKHFLAFPNEILALTRTSILSHKHLAEKQQMQQKKQLHYYIGDRTPWLHLENRQWNILAITQRSIHARVFEIPSSCHPYTNLPFLQQLLLT